MKVQVAAPEVEGETVVFRWEQSAPNPFQRQDAFFFRYEGLNLATFSPLLFYEVFLALQLKVFAAYDEPVEVTFPEPLPRSTVDFWRAFHDAGGVTIGPIQASIAYEPWRATSTERADRRPYAVFFGGGKDSLLSTELLVELYGSEQVLLIQFVGPLNLSQELEQRLTARQEGLMLRPARQRLGVATQRIFTDYQAQFRREGFRARPHIELYSAGALPVLLARGISLVTFSHAWTEYARIRSAGGWPHYRFAASRTEILADQSRHYRRALGADLTVTNLALPFSGLAATRLLVERYPTALPEVVPCTTGPITGRWCYHCRKCRNFALLGLALGHVVPDLDYERLFTEGKYVLALVAYAEGGVERDPDGNAPWTSELCAAVNYATVCQMVAHLSPELVADRLSPTAMANLRLIQALFGQREYPAIDQIPAQTIDLLNHETARDVARIAREHLALVTDPPEPHRAGRTEVSYDVGTLMPARTARVAHLHAAPDWQPAGLAMTEGAR